MNDKLSLLTILSDKLIEAKNIGLTQSKICKDLGISTNTISRYKSQKGQMTTDTYERIINYINDKLNEN